MTLNLQTDYALRVLMLLAKMPDKQLVTVAVVGEQLNISINHLTKIIAKLGQLNYIETIRGVGGGIRLKASTSDINIGQVVTEFESTLEVVNCKIPECPFREACKLKGVIDEAVLAFIEKLKEQTLHNIL